MTVIRLDAATLAKVVAAGDKPVYLADGSGRITMRLTGLKPVEEADEPFVVRADPAEDGSAS